MKLLACSDKGLIEFDHNHSKFQFKKVHFLGQPTSYIDCYNYLWRVAINHRHWGPKIQFSKDQGNIWTELQAPKFPAAEDNQSILRSIWTITAYEDESYYVGVEPAGIFHTKSNGEAYEFSTELWNHPTRKHWVGGGKGSTNPFLHHIVVDPTDQNHLYVGISCAGVLESFDGGQSWKMINKGLRADFLPDPNPEAGYDPHSLRMSSQNPEVIWQQNHCGIFRTENGGKSWEDLTQTFPESGFGFAIAVDESNDQRAWVIPCESDSMRIAPKNALVVYSTSDGGKSWKKLANGLPQEGAFDIVLRHGLDIKGPHLVFGTNNGNLYHSDNYGESWSIITQNLSPIRCVKILE